MRSSGCDRKVVEKSLTVDDLSGGSFTLSNPGREGNLYGFAIINQPQVGILRMGEVKKRPVVIEVDGADAIAIRTMMYLALSYDHRVIDGVLGNSFLYRDCANPRRSRFRIVKPSGRFGGEPRQIGRVRGSIDRMTPTAPGIAVNVRSSRGDCGT